MLIMTGDHFDLSFRKADPRCAARDPVFSDSTIYEGSSLDAVNFCPSWVKSRVFLSTTLP